jgi:hypothetical protein
MRPTIVVLLVCILGACGGDSSGPSNVFPNAAGVYNVTGSFDGLSSSDAHFEGTLTLTQASQQSGTLGGSAAYLVTINGQLFNINTSSLNGAAVSPAGIVTFSLVDGGDSWTFSATRSSLGLTSGRHTLSTSSGTASGSWSGSRASAAIQGRIAAVTVSLDGLAKRIAR